MRIDADQREAIESNDSQLAVVASAGAGKTTVITERFIRLVSERGYTADQILTVTFTRKAAAEMKRRVVSRLKEIGLDDQAQIAETGPIQTIHSFCERLLRENAFVVGIDPDFEVLQDSESELLWKRCLRDVLQYRLRDDFAVLNLLRHRAGLGGFNVADRMDENVYIAAIKEFAQPARGTLIGLPALEEIYSSSGAYSRAVRKQVIAEHPDLAVDAFEDASLGEWLEAIEKSLRVKKSVPWLKSPQAGTIDEEAAFSYAVGRIGVETWSLYETELSSTQKFDFTALEKTALYLVESNELVLQRLADEYKAILVDESQDVNPLQHRLIQGFKIENSLIVGDSQQSIYGFRQADPKLFGEIVDTRTKVVLRSNYRSSPGVLRFVNDTFREIWPDNYGSMLLGSTDESQSGKYEGVELWPVQKGDWATIADFSQQQWKDLRPSETLTILVSAGYEARLLARELEIREVPHAVAGGTEQFFARMEARDTANALACTSDPNNDFAMLAFLRSPYVGLSLDTVVLLSQKKPIYNQLDSFEPTDGADVEKLANLMQWFPEVMATADRVPAWELLNELLHRSPFFETIASHPKAEQQIANTRKLLSLAAANPELSGLEFADRIRNVKALEHKEGDAPTYDENDQVVKIMTIHKAKGLEFDRVVVAGLFRPRGGTASRNQYVDLDTGLVAAHRAGNKSAVFEWLKEKSRNRVSEESLRQLYVAATRAKSRLCLCVPENMSARGMSGTLAYEIARVAGYPNRVDDSIRVAKSEPLSIS